MFFPVWLCLQNNNRLLCVCPVKWLVLDLQVAVLVFFCFLFLKKQFAVVELISCQNTNKLPFKFLVPFRETVAG